MFFDWIVLPILLVVFFVSRSRTKRRFIRLEERLARLESNSTAQVPTTTQPVAEKAEALKVVKAQVAPAPLPPRKEPWRKWGATLEKALSENWTGILGSAALVLGVGFLGVYAALQLEPFLRFLSICALSVGLVGLFALLKRRQKLLALGQWLGSAGVAIFLFACVGASSIEGLRWVENPQLALALVGIAIATNFAFAFVAQKESFISLHTVLSLAALSLHTNNTTLVVATVVALSSIAFVYRRRWDVSLGISLVSFFAFFGMWRLGQTELLESSRMMGVASAALVFLAAASVHYRKDYATPKFKLLPLIVHILNWSVLGLCGMMLASGHWLTTLLLASASVLAFFAARVAKARDIQWVYRVDTVFAQALMVIALATLNNWGVGYLIIAAFIVAQSFLFAWIASVEADSWVSRIGKHFSQVVLAGFVVLLFAKWPAASETVSLLCTFGLVLAGSAYYAFKVRREAQGADRVIGALLPMLAVAGYYAASNLVWTACALSVLLIVGLLLRRRFELEGLGVGLMLALASIVLLTQKNLSESEDVVLVAWHVVPFALVLLAAYLLDLLKLSGRSYKAVVVYLSAAFLVFVSRYVGEMYSPLAPGLIWLLASVGALEMARVCVGQDNRENSYLGWHWLNAGFALVALFLIEFVRLYLPLESYLWILQTRTWVSVFALAVFGLWYFSNLQGSYKTWTRVQPLFLELILAVVGINIALMVPDVWHATAWALAALVIFGVGQFASSKHSRLRLYGLLAAWTSGVQLAVMTSSMEVPSLDWFEQPWFAGSVALVLQVLYLFLAREKLRLKEIEFPYALTFLPRFSNAVERRQNLWVYYPFFATTAIYLYWRFDAAVLTLLWVAECFIIFGLSLFLREPQFRIVSLTALGLSLLRLVFFDMAQTETLMRGIVFVGVGCLMLGMNYLYRRFKA